MDLENATLVLEEKDRNLLPLLFSFFQKILNFNMNKTLGS